MREAGITEFSESSVAQTLISSVAVEHLALYDLIDTLEQQTNPLTATGTYLDRIGSIFGVPRRQARPATTIGATSGVVFTNRSNQQVNIPEGTLIWSSRSPYRRYRTISSLTLAPNQQASVHVVAESNSSAYHVAAGELNQHGLQNPNVTVSNPNPIVNAVDVEDDESYRARILQSFQRRYTGTAASLQAEVSNIPGVNQVRVVSAPRGAGTVDVWVVPDIVPPSQELVAAVRETVAGEVAPGIDWRVRWPRIVPVDVVLRLRWSRSVSSSTVSLVVDAVRSYIDSSGIPVDEETIILSPEHINSVIYPVSSNITGVQVELYVDGEHVTGDYIVPRFSIIRSRNVNVVQ